MNIQTVKNTLLSKEINDAIILSVGNEMKHRSFSYETFGKEIEPYVAASIKAFMARKGFAASKIKIADNKNDFPDITFQCDDGNIALEIKSGNHFKKSKNNWERCNNSNNDLGTINKWPEKIKAFGGENIYFLFIEYSMNDDIKELNKVTFAPFYFFLDTNSNGVLKYREKDGNLRPKNFNTVSPFKKFEDFEKLFQATESIRANNIIIKHFKTLTPEQRKALLQKLSGSL